MANKQVKVAAHLFFEAFPLNPKDFISSMDVFGMSIAEFGVYCKLLFASYIASPQCYLKLDDKNICSLCKITPEEWEQYRHTVLKKFELIYIDNTPHIFNKKLLKVFEQQVRDAKKDRDEQLSVAADLLNYPFGQFWDDYDKKVGDRNRIYGKYIKLSDAQREAIRADIPKRKAAQPDKQYRPNPETYINGKLWENEIITPTKRGGLRPNPRTNADYNEQGSTPV